MKSASTARGNAARALGPNANWRTGSVRREEESSAKPKAQRGKTERRHVLARILDDARENAPGYVNEYSAGAGGE